MPNKQEQVNLHKNDFANLFKNYQNTINCA